MATLESTNELGDIGLTVALKSEVLKTPVSAFKPKLELENVRAHGYYLHVTSLVEESVASMSWWTSHYAAKLVGLLSESREKFTLATFKSDCEAWWWAKDHVHTTANCIRPPLCKTSHFFEKAYQLSAT